MSGNGLKNLTPKRQTPARVRCKKHTKQLVFILSKLCHPQIFLTFIGHMCMSFSCHTFPVCPLICASKCVLIEASAEPTPSFWKVKKKCFCLLTCSSKNGLHLQFLPGCLRRTGVRQGDQGDLPTDSRGGGQT